MEKSINIPKDLDKRIIVDPNLTRCAQLRIVKPNSYFGGKGRLSSQKYMTSFECGIDILRHENGELKISSVIGVSGNSIQEFVEEVIRTQRINESYLGFYIADDLSALEDYEVEREDVSLTQEEFKKLANGYAIWDENFNLDDFVSKALSEDPKYSILVRGTDVKYIHQRGHTKEKAEYIANLLNNAYDPTETDVQAIVMTDEEAQAAINEGSDTPYFVVLEDGCVVFIEITPEMQNEIDSKYAGDSDEYFQEVICEKHDISINNCQWSLTCRSCVSCYGKPIRITP